MKMFFFPVFLISLIAIAGAFTPIFLSIAQEADSLPQTLIECSQLSPGILSFALTATILLSPILYYASRLSYRLVMYLKGLEEKSAAADLPQESLHVPTKTKQTKPWSPKSVTFRPHKETGSQPAGPSTSNIIPVKRAPSCPILRRPLQSASSL